MAQTAATTTVTMPRLGESVTEGTIGKWLKAIGDQVSKYDPLVEVETDKVQTEIPSPAAGVLVEILVEPTTTVPVGTELCRIEPVGASHGENGREPAAPVPAPVVAAQPDETELLRTRSSPVVRRIAAEHRIDLSAVPGTGIAGRVTKQDILAYLSRQPAAPSPEQPRPVAPAVATHGQPPAAAADQMAAPYQEAPAPEEQAPTARLTLLPGDEVVPLTPMRRQIAANMVRSERTAPHVTTVMEVDMTRVVACRAAHREAFRRQEGIDLTYVPFAIKAVTLALRQHPRLNAAWDQDRIIQRRAINIGVAVGLEDGLVVPIIKDADRLSITGLAHAVAELSARARDGALTPDEVSGGTFTVNNPGTFGSVVSTPILVQPQAAILSTEAIIKRPVVVDDMIAIRSMMNLSLSIDHRVLDGLAAARFLRQVKDWLEAVTPDTPLS